MERIKSFEEFIGEGEKKTTTALPGVECPLTESDEKKARDLAASYFKSKGVDSSIVEYWKGADYSQEYLKHPDLCFVFTEKILDHNKFNFKKMDVFDSISLTFDNKAGEKYEEEWEQEGKDMTPENSKPIGVYEFGTEHMVWEGSRRAFIAKKKKSQVEVWIVSGEAERL